MKEYKKWSWEGCKSSAPTIDYLKSVQGVPITEEEFIKGLQEVRTQQKSYRRLAKQYKRLNETFNFFGLQDKAGN